MKYNIIKNFLALFVLSYSTFSQSMELPNFQIYGENLLTWSQRRIIMIWTISSGVDSKVIAPGRIESLCKRNEITGQTIKAEVYGKTAGKSAVSLEITKDELEKKWLELKKDDADALLIQISASATGLYLETSYDVLSKAKQLEIKKTKENAANILETFGDLSTYPKILSAINEDQILHFKNANEIAIPAGYWEGATTAEDIYRYILGLRTPFTKTELESKFKKLTLEYHPDKYPGSKEYATRVFRLIRKAYTDLLDQLKEEELGGEWVEIKPETKPKTARPTKKPAENKERGIIVAEEEEL